LPPLALSQRRQFEQIWRLTAIDPDLDCISRVRFGTHWQWRLPERFQALFAPQVIVLTY
jgi:hypothetical protein